MGEREERERERGREGEEREGESWREEFHKHVGVFGAEHN